MKTLILALATVLAPAAQAAGPDPADWPAVEAAARGQTVYWHAWGGDPRINAYVAWAAAEVEARYGVTLEHVRLADTGEAIARILSERAAGRDSGGAVDLVWINGENFAALKDAGLLYGPWAEATPNWPSVDATNNPAILSDFTVPTEGYESPWGLAQIVFYHDAAVTPDPPRSAAALLDWAAENPGRFAYPAPPDFLGEALLKQLLLELAPDPGALSRPADDAAYAAATEPLWDYLDTLTPHLWRSGRTYPRNQAQLRQLLADDEIDLAYSYNPAEASNAIESGDLPQTARSYVFEAGTLANAHFVAIPYNASAKEGAMVVANFLLSPEAQAHKQDPAVWGDFTVLDVPRLPEAERARFEALDLGPATLSPEALAPARAEPHPSWARRLEADWTARYGVVR